jgi:uncharacterized RDD family membrane protein YckC
MDRGVEPGDPLGGTQEPPRRLYESGPTPPGAFAPRSEPERLPPDVVFADWWKRATAAVIDLAIVGGATLVILALLGVGFFADGHVGFGEIVVGVVVGILIFAIIMPLYGPFLMARTNGQTLGKMALGIRVARANGARVDFWWSVLREVVVKGILLGVAGSLTGGIAYLVDWLWPLFDSEERALHDYLVDSRVINARQ